MAKAEESVRLPLQQQPTYKATEGGASPLPVDSPCFGNEGGLGHNDVPLTAGLLVADVIGAGILSAAVAVADLGWFLGAVVIVVLLLMNMHTSVLMWRIRMGCPDTHTYMGLVGAAFSRAPARQRDLVVALTGFAQYSSLFGVLCLYTLSFGKSLGMAMYDVHVCLPQWTILGCILLLPFVVTARSMGSYQSLIWFNILTIIGTVGIPLWVMAARAEEGVSDRGAYAAVAPISLSSSMAGLSKIAFAFSSQFMVTEIISEMKDPADFPKAYLVSAPFQGFVLLICGLGGYYYLGSNADGMILDNIPFGRGLQMAAACLLLHMLVTYLLKGVVLCRAIHSYCDQRGCNEDNMRGWSQWGAIVVATLAASWFIAQLVPFFGDMVELLGGTCTPFCCFVIPIVAYLQWARTMGGPEAEPSKAEWCLIAVELLLAIALMLAVPYFSMQRISANWTHYGAPFSCHCEGLWNTCDCSGSETWSRPGMDQCHAQHPTRFTPDF